MSLKDSGEWIGVYGEAGSGKEKRMLGEVEGRGAYIDVYFLIWWRYFFSHIAETWLPVLRWLPIIAWMETAQAYICFSS